MVLHLWQLLFDMVECLMVKGMEMDLWLCVTYLEELRSKIGVEYLDCNLGFFTTVAGKVLIFSLHY